MHFDISNKPFWFPYGAPTSVAFTLKIEKNILKQVSKSQCYVIIALVCLFPTTANSENGTSTKI